MNIPNSSQGFLFDGLQDEDLKKRMSDPRTRPLRFVTLLHDATRLHYDFRLELTSILKSWVLPAGASVRAGEKREAILVEDHGKSSLTDGAERVILPGNYGAGTVLIWDRGNYHIRDVAGRNANLTAVMAGLEKGMLRLILEGQRLKGEFKLFRDSNQEQDQWLLVKEPDEFAANEDITLQNRSMLTNRTLAEIASSNGWWTHLQTKQALAASPYSEEELKQMRQKKAGMTLNEFIKKMDMDP